MRTVSLPDGEVVPALGQGTWRLGERSGRHVEEIAAIRDGIAHGLRVIDTAEMYGEGATESFLAQALDGLRDQVFLVSKAYPQNAGRDRLAKACDRSLRRLNTDRLDLYLLHWRGGVPLDETVAAMHALQQAGKIRHWGVSNLDTEDMIELEAAGGQDCATNQVLYNLTRRGPEYDLLPWMRARRMPVMAYSPIEQGRLAQRPELQAVADRHGVGSLQIALAWLLQRTDTIVIPKTGRPEHMRQNLRAMDIVLADEDLAVLDRVFPPPAGKAPLAML
jgi:diketogulonate reductase-like aldo/keto reductase